MTPHPLAAWLVDAAAAVANALLDAIPASTFDAHVADALAVANGEREGTPTFDRLIRDFADFRVAEYGDEDFAEWGRELRFEEAP